MALEVLAWKIFQAELPIKKFKNPFEMPEFESFLVNLIGKITCEMYSILLIMIDMLFRVAGYKPIKPWRTFAPNANMFL